MGRAARSGILVLLALAGLCSCGLAKPSILVISIDSLRYDDAFGQAAGRPVAPRLQAFARESVVFDAAYTAAPWTTPAMMSVMTGLPAPAHGVEEWDRALAASVPTLAERFRAAGYRTAAYVPEATLRPEYGFGRGFSIYDLEPFGNDRLSSPALASKILNRIDQWSRDTTPFFAWVHLWDPHFNYIPPAPFDAAFASGERPSTENVACLKWGENSVSRAGADYLRGKYRGEVLYTDGYVGQVLDLLKQRGLEDRVVVVVLADHGEAFLEHGWLTHTNRVDEDVVHVPLMIHWPGRLAPRRVTPVVTTAQLGRTLLQLAGVSGHEFGSLPALSFAGNPGVPDTPVLSETVRQGCLTALTASRFKYVLDHRTCRESLFDLVSDRAEQHDLAAADFAHIGEARSALKTRLDAVARAGIPRAGLPASVKAGTEAALRSLGYVGGPGTTIVNDSCPLLPRTIKLDGFGDATAPACPDDGARRCLDRITAGR